MAWKPFDNFMLKQWDGNAIDMNVASALKIAMLTVAYVPNQATDALFSAIVANEISGTNYTAGGTVLGNNTIVLAAGIVTFDGDDMTFAQSGSGFTNARIAVVYEVSSSKLIAFADFGADKGNVTGDLVLEMDAAGILTQAEV